MADRVRVRKPGQSALLNPDTGLHESPGVNDYFAADHPLVLAHPWAFGTDAEIAAQAEEDRYRVSYPVADVESATAAPGEKRATRRS